MLRAVPAGCRSICTAMRCPSHLTSCRTAQREGRFVHFPFTYARKFGHFALLALLLPEVWEVDLDAEILFPLAFKEFQ